MYIAFQDDPNEIRYSAAYGNICNSDPKKQTLQLNNQCFTIFKNASTISQFCKLKDLLYPVDSFQSIDFEVCAGETLALFNNQLDLILPTKPFSQTTTTTTTIGPSSSTQDPSSSTTDPSSSTQDPSSSTQDPSSSTTDPSSSAQTTTTTTTTLGPVPNYIANTGESIPASPDRNYYLLKNDKNYVRGIILWIDYPSVDKNGDDVPLGNMSSQITQVNRLLVDSTFEVGQFYSHLANPVTLDANKLINILEITNPNENFSIKVSGLIIYVKSNNDPGDCSC